MIIRKNRFILYENSSAFAKPQPFVPAIPIQNRIKTRLRPARHCSIGIGTTVSSESSGTHPPTERGTSTSPAAARIRAETERQRNQAAIALTRSPMSRVAARGSLALPPSASGLLPGRRTRAPRRRGRFRAEPRKEPAAEGEFRRFVLAGWLGPPLRVLGGHAPRGPCDGLTESLQEKPPARLLQ